MPLEEVITDTPNGDNTNTNVDSTTMPTPPPLDENGLPPTIKVYPEGFVVKNVEWFNSYLPKYNERNGTDLTPTDNPSDDEYVQVKKDFEKQYIDYYNESNKKFNLNLPEVTSVADITPEAEDIIQKTQTQDVLNQANKQLDRVKGIFPELKDFKPFESVEDMQQRADLYEEEVKKSTTTKTKKEDDTLLGNINTYIDDFNKKTGASFPKFKDVKSAKIAITPTKEGKTLFEQQLDVYESEHPIIEPITLQNARPVVDNTRVEKVTGLEWGEQQNKIAERKAQLKQKATDLYNKGVLTPMDVSYMAVPKSNDIKWNQDAATITSERVLELQSEASSLMPEYKRLQASINDKTQRGIPVSEAELTQFNNVKEDIQGLLDASEVMQGVAKNKAVQLYNLRAEDGTFMSGLGRTALGTTLDLTQAVGNLVLSIAPHITKDFTKQESEEAISKMNSFVDDAEQWYADKFGLASKEYVENTGGLKKAVYDVVGLLPYVAVSPLRVPGLTLAMMTTSGFAQEKEALLKDPSFKDLSADEKDAIAFTKGLVGAVVMEMGLKGSRNAIVNNITYDVLNTLPKAVGLNTMRSYVGRKAMDYISGIASGGASFGLLNTAGTFASHGINEIVNLVKDKEVFAPTDISDMLIEAWESASEGMLTGALLGASTGIVQAVKKGTIDTQTFKTVNKLMENPVAFSLFQSEMRKQVIDKAITPQEAKANIEAMRIYKDIASQIPKDLPIADRKAVTDLMLDNRNLEAQKAGLSPAFVKPIDVRIAENNKAIEKIADDFANKDVVLDDLSFDSREGANAKIVELSAQNPDKGYVVMEKDGTFTVKDVPRETVKPQAETITLADKIRSLKMPKDALKSDPTLGLYDFAIEEIAQWVEDGMEVAKAIGKILSDIRYKDLNKDEIEKRILGSVGVGGDGKKITITGYRNKGSKDVGENGTFYTQSEQDRPTNKKEISFDNALVLTDEQVEQFEGLPNEYLAYEWFPDVDFTKEAKRQGISESGHLMDKMVTEEAIKRGYDGIVYGTNEIVDLRTHPKAVEQSLKETTKATKAGNSASADTTLADKVRSLKSKKGTLQTDITGGLKDLALEEIAQLIEDGAVVIEAIKKVLSDAKYAKLDKDEIEKAIVDITNDSKKNISDFLEEAGVENSEYKFLYDIAEDFGVTVGDFNSDHKKVKANQQAEGLYTPDDNTIYINRNKVNTRNKINEVLSHEVIHAIIANRFERNSYKQFNSQFDTELRELRKIILPILDREGTPFSRDFANRLRVFGGYEELATYGLTHKEFAKWLDTIPAEGVKSESKTLWGVLKEMILSFIGAANKLNKTQLDVLTEILDKHILLPQKTTTETKTLADKVRALKSKGTLQTDFTLGLKDLALEEIAQLIEDGAIVIDAISKALSDTKYASLNKDEIREMVLATLPIEDKLEGENADARTKRISQELKDRGYTDTEVEYITKGEIETRTKKVEQDRKEAQVLDALNVNFNDSKLESVKDKINEAIDKMPQVAGNEIILENAIRKFKAQHEVSTPSAKKVEVGHKTALVTSVPKEKSVMLSVNEKKALVDQIKVVNRSTKDVTEKYKEVSAIVHETLKGHKTTISTKKLDAIQRRMGMLKVASDEAVRKYVTYIEKVLANAEYADQLSMAKRVNRRLKKALNNDKIPSLVRSTIESFLLIDPLEVSDINKHMEIAKDLYDATKSSGVRVVDGQILDMTRKAVDIDKVRDYIDAEWKEPIQEELPKSITGEDNTDMVKEYLQSKFDRLSEYAKRVLETGNLPDGEPVDFTPHEVSMIRKLTDIRMSNIESVKDQQEVTEALDHLLVNGDMGLIPHILDKYKNAMDVKAGINALTKATADGVKLLRVSKFFSGITSAFKSAFSTRGSELDYLKELDYLRAGGLRNIDNYLKNFADHDIFDTGFGKVASAYSGYKARLKDMDSDRIERKLLRSNWYDIDKTLSSKFKITAYLRQLEYESNPNSKSVIPAIDYLLATMQASKEGKHPIQGEARKMLQNIIDKYTENGQINLSKLDSGMTDGEKEAVKDLRSLYDQLKPYHDKVAIDIRNKPFAAIENYSHINAYHQSETGLTPSEMQRQGYGEVLSGTKSGTVEARSGKVSPINMDPFSTANVAMREVLLDYFMTNPLRNMDKIAKGFVDYSVSELEKYPEVGPSGSIEAKKAHEVALKRKYIALSVRDIFEELKKDTLERSFYESTPIGDAIQLIAKRTVQYQLARIDKLVSELGSNIGYVSFTAPKQFITGISKYLRYAYGNYGHNIVENVSSSNVDRLYPHGGISSARTMDTRDFDISTADNQNTTGKARRMILQSYYNTLGPLVRLGQKTVEGLITQGDLAVIRPLWFGSMAREFKKITGTDIDFDKIATNDIFYRDQYESAIEKSRQEADRQVINAGASKNPWVTSPRMSNTTKGGMKMLHIINNYMRGFSMNEYEVATDAIMALHKGGKLSRTEAAQMLAGITVRAGVYKAIQVKMAYALVQLGMWTVAQMKDSEEDNGELAQLIAKEDPTILSQPDSPEKRRKLNKILNDIFGYEGTITSSTDKEAIASYERQSREPSTFTEDFAKGIAQTFTSLITGRNFGNIVNSNLIAPAVEYANRKMRESQGLGYNKYQDNLLYDKLPDPTEKNWVTKMIENQLGPYSTGLIAPIDVIEGLVNWVQLNQDIEEVNKDLKEAESNKNKDDIETFTKKKNALLKKAEQGKKEFYGKMVIGISALTGAIPSIKTVDAILEKLTTPPYRVPKDIKTIEKNIDAVEIGVPKQVIIDRNKKRFD